MEAIKGRRSDIEKFDSSRKNYSEFVPGKTDYTWHILFPIRGVIFIQRWNDRWRWCRSNLYIHAKRRCDHCCRVASKPVESDWILDRLIENADHYR